MKKTKATALTAAIFAATMNFSSCGSQQLAEQSSNAAGSPLGRTSIEQQEYDPSYSEPQTVYGPPQSYDPYYDDPQDVYGPPPGYDEPTTGYDPYTDEPQTEYGPIFFAYGDVNHDQSINSDDLTLMKLYYNNPDLMDYYEVFAGDVNKDGTLDLDDINQVTQFLLGEIDYFEILPQPTYGPPIEYDDETTVTTSVVTTTTTTTTTTETTTVPVTVYGPPSTMTTTTSIIAQPDYGPPIYFGIDWE